MKQLTKAEEAVMQILWKIQKGFLADIMKEMPDPKPANSTVSTFIKILERKGFISHRTYGKIHEYFPRVSKEQYTKDHLNGLLEKYFSNSYTKMVSFLSKSEDLSIQEIEEIITMLQNQMKERKNKRHE
ncbi:MAG: BlaI/MecI/CopY family transcriptional regulator [Cytophagales bacterium]|nr:BlaI/MecI/CopY family transcriptional regulator [Cytophagales bacterium]